MLNREKIALTLALFVAMLFGTITAYRAYSLNIITLEVCLEYYLLAITLTVATALFKAFCTVIKLQPKHPFILFINLIFGNFREVGWARITLWAVAIALTLGSFTTYKTIINLEEPFIYDTLFMALDRAIFFDMPPWQITHSFFSNPVESWAIMHYYNISFGLFWISLVAILMQGNQSGLRAQYCLATIFSFILIGTIAASMLPAAGPCYFNWVHSGASEYDELIGRLQRQNNLLQEITPSLSLYSLEIQEYLKEIFNSGLLVRGGGISATPSMHVAASTLVMLAGIHLNRKLGSVLGIGVILTWIGSIHLAWHYAIDGILSFLLTILVWNLTSYTLSTLALLPEIYAILTEEFIYPLRTSHLLRNYQSTTGKLPRSAESFALAGKKNQGI